MLRGEVAGICIPGRGSSGAGARSGAAASPTDGGRMIMPAFGAYTGALNLRDRAFAGLFREESLVAWALARASYTGCRHLN